MHSGVILLEVYISSLLAESAAERWQIARSMAARLDLHLRSRNDQDFSLRYPQL
jgi:hypothetical protein